MLVPVLLKLSSEAAQEGHKLSRGCVLMIQVLIPSTDYF